MAEDEKGDKITIEIKITVPSITQGVGGALSHFLKASEEIMKAGKSVVVKPQARTRIKKVEIK
ncbi:MAG: hypothetical protein M0Z77_07510 [Thermoplasmatales archaeon]|jgi:hypothetical protein|nr:hypothetical protein [Candidatus Thermoplasmatota archaeon]MCL6002224.1 hypothetical protein [Candidatus Thermoplasmatota archaeon]MDA8055479.1 hypothetical protein [Thermoplasmatales archaeon]